MTTLASPANHRPSVPARPYLPGLWLLALVSTAACSAHPQPVVISPSLHEFAKQQQPTTFIGEGRLSHAPEYIELTVTVEAECYPTPMAANKAADGAVAEVMALLRTTLDPANPKDGVFTQGGYSRPFSRYESGRTVCRGTFGKTASITVKTSRIADFASRYPDIQEQVLTRSLRQPDDKSSERPTTYATLSTPQPRLYYETREKLEQSALADALVNARQKLEATAAKGCGERTYEIVRMVERDVNEGRPIAYGRSQPSRSGSGSALELDAIWINKILEVAFATKPGKCEPLGSGGAV